jgi:hypothetical protein
MRIIKDELQSIKYNNEKLIKSSREQEELNEILLKKYVADEIEQECRTNLL